MTDGAMSEEKNLRLPAPARLLCTLMVMLQITACAQSQEERVLEGRSIYVQECAHCHQFEGQGYRHVYPHLAGNPIVMLDDPNPTIDVVLHGRGSMPPFRDELEVEKLAQVISYIRHAWGNNASPVTPTQMK